ncbi:response regulator [Pelagibius sp. 7325]|uniref:response regulator transcription factor n=1 Tax=Pelagibius sp. 7325 TaxID=3131994 RepID=UPI0030ED741C
MSKQPLRVAVVDDDSSVRRALQRILTVLDVSVEAFASGEDFLQSLGMLRPDCVVLDLHMPGLSGLEVQQRLKKLDERLPVVIVTGHHEPGMRRRCLLAGAAGYLRKPIDGEVLRHAIDLAVEEGA